MVRPVALSRVRQRVVVAGIELLPLFYEHIDFQVAKSGTLLESGLRKSLEFHGAALARCSRASEWR